MNKIFKFACAFAASALVAVPAFADDEPDYLRSSLYTILVNSKTQNDRIEKENNEVAGNEYMEMVKGFTKTDAKKAANDNNQTPLSQLPQQEFTNSEIPAQFNNHNLLIRTIDYDALRAGISKDDAKAVETELTGKKKSAFGGFAKGLAGSALSSAAGTQVNLINEDDTQDYMLAVVKKFLAQDNTASKMMARWFDYKADGDKHWDDNLGTLTERAMASLSVAEQNGTPEERQTAVGRKQFNLIPNTFLMTVNFSFRSNKAIVAEAQKLAGGILGSGAGALLGAAASAAAGDGYSVQANTTLWRLHFDEGVEEQVSKMIEENKTIDDMIAAGFCKLEFVGKDKATARVRQSLFSDKPISALVSRATTRAIDAAIAKLQEKNEVFRTVFPISACEPDGTIKVKIGAREGVSKGDTYAILEKQEDANGKITYKEVGTVKPNEKAIWNNLFAAADEAEENSKNKDGKDDSFDNDAVNLGYTSFLGKKGKDFNGYYIQLKKKK